MDKQDAARDGLRRNTRTGRDDLQLFRLYTECEELFDNLNMSLLEEKILSLSDTAHLQHYLNTEGCKLSFQQMVEMRLKLLQNRNIVVLVAGEFSAGKSTIVNVLMGGDYLPMGWGQISKIVCEIQHSDKKQATLTFTDREETEVMNLENEVDGKNWERVRHLIKTDKLKQEDQNVSRIVVEWPIQALEGFSLTYPTNREHMGGLVRGELSHQFPSSFIDRLQRPYVRSFDDSQTQRQQSHDTSQTHLKQRYGESPSRPIPIPPQDQRLQLLKEPTTRSVDFTSDEAPKTLSGRENVPDVPTDIGGTTDEDETEVKQIDDGTDVDVDGDDSYIETLTEETLRHVATKYKPFTFSFVDCPGLNENDNTTFRPSRDEMNRCCSFFFIMDESRDEGVHENGIQQFMKDIDDSFKARNMDLRTDILLFFANKIDLVDEEEPVVVERVLKKVKETWGLAKGSQIMTFNARKNLKKLRKQSTDLDIFRKIQHHLSNCMWLWLEEQYIWLLNCLHIASTISSSEKLPQTIKTVIAEPVKTTRQIALQVQSELKNISDTEICEAAWADLKNILHSVGSFNDIDWNEKDIEDEVAEVLGVNRDKYVDWSDLYGVICEITCKKIESKITSSDGHRKALKDAQFKFGKSIKNLYRRQNEQLKSLQEMLPQAQSDMDRANLNGAMSIVTPLLASLAVRGIHLYLPFYLLAVPAVPIFLIGNSVWEEQKHASQESKREEFLENRVTFVKKETDKIIQNATKEFKDKKDVSKSALFQYMFKELGEKYRIHQQTEEFIKMADYLETVKDQSTESVFVDLFIRAATIVYIEEIVNHTISTDDIAWETRNGVLQKIGGVDSNVTKAVVNGNQEAAVKEFRFSYTSAVPDKMFGYRECYHLRKLSGRNSNRVVKLLGTNIEKTRTELILRVVLERHAVSLAHIVDTPSHRDPARRLEEFKHYTRECLECISYLHRNDIIHKNIKPINFLLVSSKVTYNSVVISGIGGLKTEEKLTFCTSGPRKGTRAYLAPEISVMNMGHSKASDVYCMGLVIWELWYRQLSYEHVKLKNNIEHYEIPKLDIPRTLLLQCLQKDPNRRATVDDLLWLLV